LLTRSLNNEGARLAALLIGLFAVSAVALGTLVYVIAGHAMRAELHDFISADQGAVLSGYRTEGLSEAVEVVQQLTAVTRVAGRYLLQDRNGHRLAGDLPPMPARAGTFVLPLAEGHEVLGEGDLLPDGSYLFVGETTDRLSGARLRILGSFAWVVGATILLATLVGALLSARYLRRIDAIIRTCHGVEAGGFAERVPMGRSRGQLDRLSMTINEMLERTASLVESLRQVSSDIAHDLRTPLTRLRQRLERARASTAADADAAIAMDAALADCDAILALFSALLRISQIEVGTRRASFAPERLDVLLRSMVDLYLPVAEDGELQLALQCQGTAEELTVAADRMLLTQMFSNLVENAIRHAGRGAHIAIDCRSLGTQVRVQIVDSGPGIPAEEREKVFHRLYRLERSRNTPGNGLGLALVAAIAKLHRCRITLGDARPGLRVTLTMHRLCAADMLPTTVPPPVEVSPSTGAAILQ
jgi:signal transduction histidine kinase